MLSKSNHMEKDKKKNAALLGALVSQYREWTHILAITESWTQNTLLNYDCIAISFDLYGPKSLEAQIDLANTDL